MNALEQLAQWATHVSNKHTPSADEWATQALIDTIGCMIAGSQHEASQIVLSSVSRWGIGRSSVVGSANRLPAPWAALVMGLPYWMH